MVLLAVGMSVRAPVASKVLVNPFATREARCTGLEGVEVVLRTSAATAELVAVAEPLDVLQVEGHAPVALRDVGRWHERNAGEAAAVSRDTGSASRLWACAIIVVVEPGAARFERGERSGREGVEVTRVIRRRLPSGMPGRHAAGVTVRRTPTNAGRGFGT